MNTKLRRSVGRSIMVLVLAAFFMAAVALPAMAGASAKTAVWHKGPMERHRHHRPPPWHMAGLADGPEIGTH